MNYYDYIFIGSSISNLLAATCVKNKNILIIEKDIYIGGAWRTSCDYYKNIDLVGHLIVPTNNTEGNKIIEHFRGIDLSLNYINKKDFLFETENYRTNNKQGVPIIATHGWTDFYKKIVTFVKKFNNIKIITNTEIIKITYEKKYVSLLSKKRLFICGKLVIPMYCNIDKIHYNTQIIEIPSKQITNTHVLLDISFCERLKITKYFQAFLDQNPIGVFDRVTVSKLNTNNCLLSCRLSKHYKDVENIENLFLPFLKKKQILNNSCEITNIYYFNYKCSYRNQTDRNTILDTCNGLTNICILNTVYMGHFLEDFINNKLNF